MKKLTKLLLGFSVLAVLMVCMTTVSFAGTADDKVTVFYHAAEVGKFVSMDRALEVQGDLVEQNFPEVAKYEPKKGVSWLDAIVADHIRKYGADKFKEHFTLIDGGQGAWVTSAYDQGLLAAIDGTTYIDPIHSEIKDGANLTALLYNDGDYNRTFSYFDKMSYTTNIYEPLTVDIKATSYDVDYPVDDAKLAIVNTETGEFKELETTFADGKASVYFDDPGWYLITAIGKVTYDSWGSTVTTDYMGAVAYVKVSDAVLVSFAAGMPGSYDYVNEMLFVSGDLVETYFPEMAEYECKGVSFADALVAAHIDKYGEADFKNHMDFGAKDWVAKQFDHTLCGCYAVNSKVLSNGVNTDPVKQYDALYAGAYSDETYADLYYSFDQAEVYTTAGKEVTLNIVVDNWGTPVVPKEVTVKQLDGATCELSDFTDATYDNGKITLKFSKAGVYRIAAEGLVDYEGYYGPATGKIMGAYCYVEVEDAVPAKPVIKSAKRNTKTKATVTWKKAKNAKKYEVAYRVKGAKKWTTKKTSSTKIVLKKLKAKKAYQVKVRSINGSAKSAYSKVKTIKKK